MVLLPNLATCTRDQLSVKSRCKRKANMNEEIELNADGTIKYLETREEQAARQAVPKSDNLQPTIFGAKLLLYVSVGLLLVLVLVAFSLIIGADGNTSLGWTLAIAGVVQAVVSFAVYELMRNVFIISKRND